MEPALISPASATLAGIPAKIFFILIPLAGVGIFAWIMRRRMAPLLKAAPDNRFQRIPERIRAVLKIWLGQWRHPRYMLAGVLHIILFFGFLILFNFDREELFCCLDLDSRIFKLVIYYLNAIITAIFKRLH